MVLPPVLLLPGLLSPRFRGWPSDRMDGSWTVLLGGLAQTLGMLRFLATQDEAGFFFAAAAAGLGFAGLVPAHVLAAREHFPAIEASWRVPALPSCSLSGLVFGAWIAGLISDGVGFHAAGWWAGIAFNLARIVPLGALLAWMPHGAAAPA